MGSLGISVKVSGDGDRETARRMVWAEARKFISEYWLSEAYREINEYLDNADPGAEIDNPGDYLSWIFPDLAGMCYRSQAAWLHWLELWMAARWSTLEWAIEFNGLRLESPRPDLARLLGPDSGDHFLVLVRPETREYLWRVRDDGLSGDGRSLRVDELTDDERAAFEEARELCRCDMCCMLRPEDGTIDRFLDDLRLGGRFARRDAFILGHMQKTRPDVLLALVTTPVGDGMNDFPERADLVERCADRLDEAWSVLRPMLPGLTGDACNLAVVALMTHYYDRPGTEQSAFLAELADASREDGRNSVVAGNYLRILGRNPDGV